ncbi:MAG: PH domain-containing protein [Candidatus Anammoximicrobium sp.]|nr:PH domain-containing protein [Candidatus Anammoximicrobium sp.]
MSTGRPAPDPKPNQPAAQSAGPPDEREPYAAGSEPASAPGRFRDAVRARQGEDEEPEADVWQGGFSSRAMFGNWLLAGVVTLVLLVAVIALGPKNWHLWLAWAVISALLWGGFGCLLAYRKLTCKYRLTTQRFIHESGLLKRVTDRIEVIDIDDVSFEQRVIERVVGVGTIKMLSSDRSHPVLVMRGIEKVKEVASVIDDLRRKERRRRGLHIESI